MKEMKLESYSDENLEVEKYLSDSIVSYGLEQLQGKEPKKLFCCYRGSNGKIMAAIMGSTTLNMFFISYVFVEEEYRNKGIGTKLLSEIEQLALDAECNIIRLNTFNKKSHAFYLNAGFVETACITNYMNGFDLVYYHKKIS